MNKVNGTLMKQLFLIIGIVFVIIFVSLGVILPRTLIPVAERNIYSQLSEPLKFIDKDYENDSLNSEVAYIYITDGNVIRSDNAETLLGTKKISDIAKYTRKEKCGKFVYKNRTYYYYKMVHGDSTKIALTNDSYITKIRGEILAAILPIVLGSFLLIGLVLIIWSSIIVLKIETLKEKVDHIEDPDYDHSIKFKSNDEITSLEHAIEDMRIYLKNNEKYRNQIYQNTSHDFKTPLTVIKSYIEAVEDNMEDKDTALRVIKEQTNKLDDKVHSLLYLNKLDYLKDSKIDARPVDMEAIVASEVDKFKHSRKDVKFIVESDHKSKFVGTVDSWETIIDNLLNNFMRYAKSEVKITIKNNKLILYNDGDNIDNDLLEGIFTPFRKGIKGEFGLGLSIVKKTLNMIKYDITIKNEREGVSFIITKK